MDLNAFERNDQFVADYNHFFPAIRTSEEPRLFIYYKSHRANVRAKVNSLRAKSAPNKADENRALADAEKYFQLMDHYLKSIE